MDAEATLKRLVEEGKITQEDIREADMRYLDKQRRLIVDALHTMFCLLDHDDNAQCSWYLESQMDNTWLRDSHIKWVNTAIGIITDVGTDWKGLRAILVAIESILSSVSWQDSRVTTMLTTIASSISEHVLTAVTLSSPSTD